MTTPPAGSRPATAGVNGDVKHVFVDVSGLRVQGARDNVADYAVRLWDARTFMFHEARADVQGSSKDNRLGNLWLVLNPILDGAMYFVVFGLILNTSSGIDNFIGFLLIGVFFFSMTTGCINASASTLIRPKELAYGGPLPLATAPLVANIRRWLSGFPSYLVLLLIILIAPPLENLGPLALLVIPLILLQMAMALGLSMIAAALVAGLPDLKNLISIGTRAWMFGSGVMFAAERFADLGPAVALAIHWNPMYWLLQHARDVLLYDQVPGLEGWLIMLLWTVSALLLGFWLVWRREGKVDDQL